ncbi:hypothetical protein [Mycobacterium sp. E3198]|uniref:hypothetical protein n=1 Tax=Mycobacterium sp. E3198 TaxID=1834143 RepID=UPI0007FC57D3|nr:hypothetical protein [Mycobacterium sp. E3198]OBG36286.1 hypothetical protein A5673_18435 [Mycobacterium sp. E3198]
MATTMCLMCGANFSARSDAIYCSPACRQKAHRARTAQRTAVLRESLRRGFGPAPADSAEATALRLSVATSVQRAREQVDRSRELCRDSERRLRESDAILRRRAPWLGN